ncbi:hypothetical protein ACVWXM_008967 [Bradyrhizobium sp. GM7.3]
MVLLAPLPAIVPPVASTMTLGSPGPRAFAASSPMSSAKSKLIAAMK